MRAETSVHILKNKLAHRRTDQMQHIQIACTWKIARGVLTR